MAKSKGIQTMFYAKHSPVPERLRDSIAGKMGAKMRKMDGWIIPLGSFIGIIVAGLLYRNPPTETNAAAWVQALGSIGAVLIAVWVSHRQYEQTRELEAKRSASDAANDLAETKAFVAAIYEELRNIWEAYERQVGPLLKGLEEGHFVDMLFPVGNDLFTIYNGASSRVGKVPDAELRKLIVGVYAKAKGLVYGFILNNNLVTDYVNFAIHYHAPNREEILKMKVDSLIAYGADLKMRDEEIRKAITDFFKCAETWLGLPPSAGNQLQSLPSI